MKKSKAKDFRTSSQTEDDFKEAPSRSDELCDEESLQETFNKVYTEVENGFDKQSARSDQIADYWDCYDCELNQNQFYNGNSEIYVPIVHDAINARVTRFSNQIFPQSSRYIDVITEDGHSPNAIISLLESYIRKQQLHTQIVKPLIRNGDIEGQYTVYCSWKTTKREVAFRTQRPTDIGSGLVDPTKTLDDIEEKEIKIGMPSVEIISDADLLVLPATAPTLEDALDDGGSVTILRRWSKAKIQRMISKKQIEKYAGKQLLEEMNNNAKTNRKDMDKRAVDAAGIRVDGNTKTAIVYETWCKFVYKKKYYTYRIYFAGKDRVLSCKRNPLWSDKLPIISCPVEKVKGSFKGVSKVQPVATFQYMANDAANEGMDSAAYALLPIIMTDPEKNPKVGSLILSLAAVWETSPKDTQFAQFPQLWKDAFEIVAAARAQVFQTLSVNPSQITQQSTSKKKPSQAEVANEQQVDILTTADAVTIIEEGILTPMLHLFLELDHQFRDKMLTVEQHGRMGIQADMQEIPVISMHNQYYLKWFGVEAAKNAQQIQQQIAAANVLRGIPPEMYPGYRMNLVPVIEQVVLNAFGPRIAPLVFENIKDQLSTDPELENELLSQGLDMPVSEMDNIQKHMQAHQQAIQKTGDPTGAIRTHMMHHNIVAMKMMQQQQGQPGMPGAPGGAGPGLQGTPRPGAQPGMPRQQGPAGMIHKDNMSDPRMQPT